MIFFKKLRQVRRQNEEAAEAHVKVKAQIDRDHERALARLAQATEQADTLSGMDNRNHYSESLTYAFRGRTAS